jgi:hypothetical protein
MPIKPHKDGTRNRKKGLESGERVGRSLDKDCDSFAATETKCGDTALEAVMRKSMHKRNEDSCATAADRVPESDGTAVNIDALWIGFQFADASDGLCSEGFIDFDEIDVFEGISGLIQSFLDGEDRCEK